MAMPRYESSRYGLSEPTNIAGAKSIAVIVVAP
jgi:hypothetical protein